MKAHLLSIILVGFIFLFSGCKKDKDNIPDFLTGAYEGSDDDYYSQGQVYRVIISRVENARIQIQNISNEGRTIYGDIHTNGKAFSINSQSFGSGVVISGTGIVDNNALTLSVEFNSTNSPWHDSETFTGVKK